MLIIAKLITRINYFIAMSVALFVLIMVLIISYDVICRYFFNSPTVWAIELSTLLFGPYFMLAGAYLLHLTGHVNVDVLYEHFSPRIKRYADRIIWLLILGICLLFAMISWPIAIEAYQGGETSFSSWNPPIWPVKLIIPIAFGLVALQCVAQIIVSFSDETNALNQGEEGGA